MVETEKKSDYTHVEFKLNKSLKLWQMFRFSDMICTSCYYSRRLFRNNTITIKIVA